MGSIPRPSCENSSDQELDLDMTDDIPVATLCLPSVNVLQTLDISNLNLKKDYEEKRNSLIQCIQTSQLETVGCCAMCIVARNNGLLNSLIVAELKLCVFRLIHFLAMIVLMKKN